MALNAITSTTRRVQFTGDNSTTTFAFTFVIEQASDIAVYFDDTKKTVTTHYTVTVNSDGTGSITTTGGNTPGTGVLVTIIGDRSISRTTEFTAGGPLTAASLENELNSQTLLISQLSERIDRCFTLPIDTDATTPLELPYNNTEASNANRILKFNSAGTAFELGSTTTNIDALAAIASDITTVSGISSNVTSVVSNSSNINTVAGSISNVNTLGSISSDITTVAGISSNVTTVAGKASLLTSDFAADMSLVTSDFVSDMALVTADFISDVNTLATTDIVNDLNLLATSDFVSDLNTLATSDFVSDLNALEAIKADVTSVANNESNINAAVSNASNINSVVSNASNINTVAGGITNINTVATNLSAVNNFANQYRIGSSDPTDSLDEGDLFYNTTNNVLKYYDGTSWEEITSGGILSVAQDTTPQLGGNLDMNGQDIVTTSNADLELAPNGTGHVTVKGNSYPGAIQFNCEANTHGQIVKAQPHSASVTNELTLPAGSNQEIVGTIATQTLTNKTINSASNTITITESNISDLGSYLENIVEDTTPQLGGSLDVNGNSIVSTSNGDISITPNGTGDVIIDGLKHPQADGTSGQFLKTDGSGQLSFATVSTELVNDTTPQLGGNLDLNSNNITGTGNIPAANLTGSLPAIDGSALTGITTGLTATAFSQAQNGYIKLSNNLLIQWGRASSLANGGARTVNFPITFPSACWAVAASWGVQTSGTWHSAFPSINTTRFTAHNVSGSTQSVWFIAVGK